MELKIRRVGNSLGASIPKEILSQLNVGEGDSLYVTRTPNGIELTPYDPEFQQAMTASRKVISRYRNALKKLSE